MSRQRVRRSFTVEVKSGARQGSAGDIPNRLAATAEPAARAPSWPWEEAAPVLETPAQVIETPKPAAAGRPRILPSLLPGQAPAAEPEPEDVVEPPLPRVRRVAAPTGEGAAPRKRGRPPKVRTVEMPALEAEARTVAADAVIIPDVPMPRAVPAAVASRGRSGGRVEEQVLRRGERWKRRLPRACW